MSAKSVLLHVAKIQSRGRAILFHLSISRTAGYESRRSTVSKSQKKNTQLVLRVALACQRPGAAINSMPAEAPQAKAHRAHDQNLASCTFNRLFAFHKCYRTLERLFLQNRLVYTRIQNELYIKHPHLSPRTRLQWRRQLGRT